MRWRARSSRLRQAGTTSTKRNSAAFSSASFEASSIAFSSAAFSGLRDVRGSAAGQLLADREQLLLQRALLDHAADDTLASMKIAVAADERTGVADAVVDELRRRGHEPLLHGALADDARRLGVGLARRRPATSPTAAPSRPSSAAGPAPARRSRPTRSAASAPRCAATPPPPPAPGSGTTPTCSRCPCAPPRRRCSRRSSTPGSPPRPQRRTTTARTSSTSPRSSAIRGDVNGGWAGGSSQFVDLGRATRRSTKRSTPRPPEAHDPPVRARPAAPRAGRRGRAPRTASGRPA